MKNIKLLKILLFIIIDSFCNLSIQSKDLTIDSFELLGQKDITAQTQPRYDLNGNTCAVIKISLPENVKFEGNIIEDIFDVNEHLLYVSPGTRSLIIKYPGYETLYYNIPSNKFNNGLEGGRTYRLKISGLEDLKDSSIINNQFDPNNYQILRFEVNPKDASIIINGLPQKPNNDGILELSLPLGTHTYWITADKYYNKEGTITLSQKDGTAIKQINLKPKFGFLSTEVFAEYEGAEILVDDNFFGKYPIINKPITNGEHIITIKKKLYLPFTQVIQVSDSSFNMLYPQLIPNYAEVEISVKDKEVEMYDNNEFIGKTNGSWKGKLESGNHRIEIRKEYFNSNFKDITIEPNVSQIINFENLESDFGGLDIYTNPPTAKIYINGRMVGESKYYNRKMTPGEYTLEVKCKGYLSEKTKIKIKGGKVEKGSITLSKKRKK